MLCTVSLHVVYPRLYESDMPAAIISIYCDNQSTVSSFESHFFVMEKVLDISLILPYKIRVR